MDIQKIIQDFEEELNDFSCWDDFLDTKTELQNSFKKLKEAINFTDSSIQLKTIFKVGDYVIYRGVINAKIIEVLEHNFYKIEDSNNDIMKAYTSSLELQ